MVRHALAVGESIKKLDNWIVDSGATCNDSEQFVRLQKLSKPVLGDGYLLTAVEQGVVEIIIQSPDGTKQIR